MLRILAVCVAAAFMPVLADAAEKKPKFGDIFGLYYTDVAGDREACRRAIQNKIALCRENTSFLSNTDNRAFSGCLPIFEEQATGCVDHFRSEAYKCEGSGSADIAGFTGFSCLVTITLDDGLTVKNYDNPAAAGSRGPEDAVGSAAAPEEAGDPDTAAAVDEPGPCQVWDGDEEYGRFIDALWSGACVDGKASGEGRLVHQSYNRAGDFLAEVEFDGSIVDGRRQQGSSTITYYDGSVNTCQWRDYELVGDTCISSRAQ